MTRRLLLLACAAALGMARKPPTRHLEALMDWNGANCSVEAAGVRVVRTPEEWKALWREAMGRPAPPQDFKDRFAVAVFLGSVPTGGYSVEFGDAVQEEGRVVVPYAVRKPGKGSFVIQAFTQPWAVRLFEGDPDEVEVLRSPA